MTRHHEICVAATVIFALLAFQQLEAREKSATPSASLKIEGLDIPSSVVVGADGKIYITVVGELGKVGDGAVVRVENGKAVPFASGFDNPRGVALFHPWIYVADKNGIWRINAQGKAEVFVKAAEFPAPPRQLTGLTADPESGLLYVAAAGDEQGAGAAIYRITPQGKVHLILDNTKLASLRMPGGLVLDGASHLLVADSGTGSVLRIKLTDGSAETVFSDLPSPTTLAWDHHGRLFIGEATGKLFVSARPGMKPVLLGEGFQSVSGLGLDAAHKAILVVDRKAGTLSSVPIQTPGTPVDETPLPVETAQAFPDLQWAGWKGFTDAGVVSPLRPILLTHAGDGSNRVFVATEQGVIHVFPNDQKAKETKVFLDIQDRVSYSDNQNEEGFLGLAFHPKFKENGEFFVFYTIKKPMLTNIVSRFRVSKDDPNRADPTSEVEILRIKKPFWNHDGGTLVFGPDGYLYIALGDGGAANDPFGNGQNLHQLLGKVLRIDVDEASGPTGKYAIPKDNPFVGQADARPEIWAYGIRNIWRMAFDRKTGKLWASDVGQNLYEEIDIITRGGNYGWNRREGLHPFGAKGTGPRPELIEPIWEYHHDIGKSNTGGCVYRGPRIAELEGFYLYADYVTGRIWGLKYDETEGRVVANRPIKDRALPIFSFGEDENGEVYMLTNSVNGKAIYWFEKLGGKE